MGQKRVAQIPQFPGALQTSIVRAQEKVMVLLDCYNSYILLLVDGCDR
jgi:hypothetical protein